MLDEFASLVAADGAPRQVPAAYLAPGNETAGATSDYSNTQKINIRFTVIIVVRNVSDSVGGAAQAEARVLSDALRVALRGWSPAAGFSRIQLASAGPASMTNGFLYWPETFFTTQDLI